MRSLEQTLRIALFFLLFALSLFADLKICLAAEDMGSIIAQTRTLILKESIFCPSQEKLNGGLKAGFSEIIPEWGRTLSVSSLKDGGLTGAAGDLSRRFPNKAGAAGERAMERMAESVGDPYTAVLSRADMEKDALMMKSGRFSGIGVELAWKGGLAVVGALPGSPALKAGLKSGDIILSVNGTQTKGMSFYRAGDLLAGESGSTANLVIAREGKTMPVSIVRSSLSLPKVSGHMLGGDAGIIKIGYFSPTTGQEVFGVLKDLQASGLRRLILDLRSNPGGDFKEGLRTAAIFHKGELIKVKSRSGLVRKNNSYAPSFAGPIVILADHGTASSAEIVALALKGTSNVRLFGQRTFGKGLIQALYSLPGGCGLRISTGQYLSRNGESIHNIGIKPDVVCDTSSQACINSALSWLNKQPVN